MLLSVGCAAAVASAGCGTVANQTGDRWYMTSALHPPSEPYGGVRQDWAGMLAGWNEVATAQFEAGHTLVGRLR